MMMMGDVGLVSHGLTQLLVMITMRLNEETLKFSAGLIITINTTLPHINDACFSVHCYQVRRTAD